MTRIGFMSDLHLDSNQFGDFERQALRHLLKEEGIDHLHIAGDLSNDLNKISLPFIEDLKKDFPCDQIRLDPMDCCPDRQFLYDYHC